MAVWPQIVLATVGIGVLLLLAGIHRLLARAVVEMATIRTALAVADRLDRLSREVQTLGETTDRIRVAMEATERVPRGE
jgi:hypothetical protein